ncbi:MAG: OB-fold nucleic acid binding domain-containing protein [Candidatus Heimdallarchaeum aukensis]|uniref:OB-fold nucleic acid binding domain-containing protein n=1 Tax=Candidatus Heimdallarchaeum aukensis TaxID=2876573 RepID=A0A9Y1BJE6_9ARCH|nr:MAG: OB-fold nucleic acid binding domain-containing protein [Candidatus Heimdallarchaeum aukensis]
MSISSFQKRFTYVEKQINEISTIGNYCIVGEISKIEDNGFQLSDETGEISVKYPEGFVHENLKEGNFVRIFGKIEGELNIIKSDIIQELHELDLNLYRKMRIIEKSLVE